MLDILAAPPNPTRSSVLSRVPLTLRYFVPISLYLFLPCARACFLFLFFSFPAVGQDGGGGSADDALQRAALPVQVPRVSEPPSSHAPLDP